MVKKASLIFYALALTAVVGWKLVEISSSCHSAGLPVTVQLARGPFTLLEFPSKQAVTRAIILFGSGDGGWSGFEEEIAFALQDEGYEVIALRIQAEVPAEVARALYRLPSGHPFAAGWTGARARPFAGRALEFF